MSSDRCDGRASRRNDYFSVSRDSARFTRVETCWGAGDQGPACRSHGLWPFTSPARPGIFEVRSTGTYGRTGRCTLNVTADRAVRSPGGPGLAQGPLTHEGVPAVSAVPMGSGRVPARALNEALISLVVAARATSRQLTVAAFATVAPPPWRACRLSRSARKTPGYRLTTSATPGTPPTRPHCKSGLRLATCTSSVAPLTDLAHTARLLFFRGCRLQFEMQTCQPPDHF